MGRSVAPILANIYMARLEQILKDKCKMDPKLKWPCLFKRFIDDGFGIMEGNKSDFEYWITEFNLLRETITIDKFKWGNEVDFMDLNIYKGNDFFYVREIRYISFPKRREQIYVYSEQKWTSKTYDSQFYFGGITKVC